MTNYTANKKILVAPLHWGLGHATRCIPIIKALVAHNFEPIIASDGGALELLKKEFPKLKHYELPSYDISYAKKGKFFKLKLITESPHILKTIKREKKLIKQIVEQEHISGIISDNRFGVRHKAVPSVFITHQLRVLSGTTTWLSSKLHKKYILKFNECWVPDFENTSNLSGKLGHPKKTIPNLKYIGPLSRLEKEAIEKDIDILVILSGPEPQRTQLEKKLLFELEHKKGHIVMVRGVVEAKQTHIDFKHLSCYNFMTGKELQSAINRAKLIISRSGYTTIMDLVKLEKKAIFIPTPGQFEQVYLAEKLDKEKIVPCVEQEKLKASDLDFPDHYSGFSKFESVTDFGKLFGLFQSE